MPIITGPVGEPVTLADAKQNLRVDHTDDDTLIASLITTARQQAEHRTGRRYGAQTWLRAYDGFPTWSIMLPDPPVTEIVSIKYDDPDGVEQTLPPEDYRLRLHSEPAVVLPVKAWPAAASDPGSVRITYKCGLDATDARWQSLRAWMLMAIGTWYQQREAGSPSQTYALPREFWDGLLDPLVFYGVTS